MIDLAHLDRAAGVAVPVAQSWEHYRALIEAHIDGQPRSQQTRIGPSELGTTCTRCLVYKLAGRQEVREAAWLPYLGTAIHAQLADAFLLANSEYPAGEVRYLIEHEVSVGQVGGVEITGHADLFDLHTGTVIDWKLVGTTTMRKVLKEGPSQTYRRQAHLYGRGFASKGLSVHAVAVAFLPRNGMSLADAFVWSEPYRADVAEQTIARADQLAGFIGALGVDSVVGGVGEHNYQEFSCSRWGEIAPSSGPLTSIQL